jgi:hypothetical protein
VITDLLNDLRDDAGLAQAIGQRPNRRVHAVLIASPWVGRSVWAVFAGRRPVPTVIVKVDADPGSHPRLRREHQALTALHRRTDLRGFVPPPVLLRSLGSRLVLVQGGLPGTPLTIRARTRLRGSVPQKEAEQQALLRWLHRLQSPATNEGFHIDADAVLRRLRRLAGNTAATRHLEARLQQTTDTWGGLTVPVVPCHGDLTAANILLHRGTVAVFDWEGGLDQRMALADLVVFLNSYARRQRTRDGWTMSREAGFRRAFGTRGWMGRLSADTFRRHLDHLGLPRDAAEGLFVTTLVELADGRIGGAHPGMSRTMWTAHLRSYTKLHATATQGPMRRDADA